MADSKSLQNSIDWFRPFINWASVTIGVNSEPAMTSANQSLQTIVGPPFIWPWNRNYATFYTNVGQQDYNAAISNFGFLESASIELCGAITSVVANGTTAVYQAVNGFNTLLNGGVNQTVTVVNCETSGLNGSFTIQACDGNSFTVASTLTVSETEVGALATAGKATELTLQWGSLSEERAQDRPTFIATQESDESGTTFTFRLMPVPDLPYQVNLVYQEAPTQFTSLNQNWGIPDQLQYIYNYFFAFFMFDYFDDPRAARYRQLAIASLLSRQAGLSVTARNLFLGNFLDLMQEETASQAEVNQGDQARGI